MNKSSRIINKTADVVNKTPYIVGLSIGLFLFFTAIILFVVYYLKTHDLNSKARKIGCKGEIETKREINAWIKKNGGLYFSNALYQYGKNKVFEIDGILVTDYAIIVVEVKNINGKITGNGKNKYWLKNLGSKSHDILSPIYQNDQHIKHLMQIFDIKIPILSLIVFGSRTSGLEIDDIPQHVLPTKLENLQDVINLVKINLMPRITNGEKKQIIHLIKKHQTKRRNHVKLHNKVTKQ